MLANTLLRPAIEDVVKVSSIEQWRALHRIADNAEPRVRRQILMAVAVVKDGTSMAKVRRSLENGELDAAYNAIPWSELEHIKPVLTKTLRAILEQAAEASVKVLPKKTDIAFDVTNPKAVAWIREHSADLVTRIGDETKLAIRDKIRRAFEEGQAPVRSAREIRELIGLTPRQVKAVENYRDLLLSEGRSLADTDRLAARYSKRQLNHRARVIARTETINASSAGQQLLWETALDDGMLDDRETRKHWLVSRDERLCRICEPIPGMNPDGRPIREQFFTPVGPRMSPTAHPQCLTGDIRVLHKSPVSVVTRRLYIGDIISIETAGGKQLTCTPNHPILTDVGWIPAHTLNVGSDVICNGIVNGKSLINAENQDAPTTIKEIYEALSNSGRMTPISVPISTEHFHGDGKGSQIAVVWADSFLAHGINAALRQQLTQQLLIPAYIRLLKLTLLRTRFQSIKRDLGAKRCSMRSGRHLHPLRLSQFAHSHKARFTSTSRLHAIQQEPMPYYRSAGLESFSQGQLGLPGQIHLGNIFYGNNYTRFGSRRSRPSDRYIQPTQPPSDGPASDIELARQIAGCSAGQILRDKVVAVNVMSFHGHVFNLETPERYYASSGIITHNCRCSVGLKFKS